MYMALQSMLQVVRQEDKFLENKKNQCQLVLGSADIFLPGFNLPKQDSFWLLQKKNRCIITLSITEHNDETENHEMYILAAGIGIVFCIILFVGYSYKQNQHSKYTSKAYKVFKEQYGEGTVISMGYAQTNAFTAPVTLMLAVNQKDHRVIEAWEVVQDDMENNCRSCEEYIGMDLNKYYKENQERIEKKRMMQQTSDGDSPKKQAFDIAVRQILGKLEK